MNQVNNNTTTQELIEAILATDDDKFAWEAIRVLHMRATKEELNAAISLCNSQKPKERELGADILAQLGGGKHIYAEESIDILCTMLKNETNDDVIDAGIHALGHIGNVRSASTIHMFTSSRNRDIREAVAWAFGLIEIDDEKLIDDLIQLSRDKDEEVRNWATFGLGSQVKTDSPEIRQALYDRLEEKDGELRGEALVGLALRGCTDILKYMPEALEDDMVCIPTLEAAEMLGDVSLLKRLTELRDDMDTEETDESYIEQFNKAIKACQPQPAE